LKNTGKRRESKTSSHQDDVQNNVTAKLRKEKLNICGKEKLMNYKHNEIKGNIKHYNYIEKGAKVQVRRSNHTHKKK
jgi:hypothetical protein